MAKVDFQDLLNEEIVLKNKDKNARLLLDILEKKSNEKFTDFLEEFNKSVAKLEKDDKSLQDKILNKSETDKEGSRDDLDDGDILISEMMAQSPDSEHESKEGEEKEEEPTIGIEVEGELSEEELDEKYPDDDLTISQKKYAYIYEKAMKEYFRLKASLDKQNIRDGEISYDDRNFAKLVRLKEVAVSAEIWFKNSTHGSYVGEKIDSIGNMEKTCQREMNDYQRQINKDHEIASAKIQSVNNEINDTLDEIEKRSALIADLDDGAKLEVMSELETLEDKYLDLNEKLESMTPNAIEMSRQEEKSKEQAQVEDRRFGFVDYQKQRYSSNVTAKDYTAAKSHEAKEKNLNENGASKLNSITGENAKDVKESMEEAIQDAIDKKDYALAARLADTYQNTLTSDCNIKDDKEVHEKVEDFSKQIESNIEEDKAKDDEESVLPGLVEGAIIGSAVGITATTIYPVISSSSNREIPGLADVVQPEEVATITAKNDKILKDVKDISEGRHTKSESEIQKDSVDINK